MQLIGFVLFSIGIMILFFAKRIVRGKTKMEKDDEAEMRMLTIGAVIAVRLSGLITAGVGLVFLMLGNYAS